MCLCWTFVGLMPLSGGLPPLPNLPNLNLPLPDLGSMSVPAAAAGTTGDSTSNIFLHKRSSVFRHQDENCVFVFLTSPASGVAAPPEYTGSGLVPPSAHHAALTVASIAFSWCGPPRPLLHPTSSLCHSHGDACDQHCCLRCTPHGSGLQEGHRTICSHGNNTNVVIMS